MCGSVPPEKKTVFLSARDIDSRFSNQRARIGFYGDECNVSENVYQPFKVLCLFVNILHFRPKDIRLSRWLVFSIRSDWLAGPITLRPILTWITWSLNVAFLGKCPVSGTWLCKKQQRFVVAEFRGDQDFHRLLWQHSASWVSKFVCFQCRATSIGPDCNYTDTSEDPLWANTEHSNASFIVHELPEVPCAMANSACDVFFLILRPVYIRPSPVVFFSCQLCRHLFGTVGKPRPSPGSIVLGPFHYKAVQHALLEPGFALYM